MPQRVNWSSGGNVGEDVRSRTPPPSPPVYLVSPGLSARKWGVVCFIFFILLSTFPPQIEIFPYPPPFNNNTRVQENTNLQTLPFSSLSHNPLLKTTIIEMPAQLQANSENIFCYMWCSARQTISTLAGRFCCIIIHTWSSLQSVSIALHNTCIEIPVISNKELQILNLAWLIHFHREFSSSALSSHRWIECPLTKLIGLSFTNYGKLKGVFFRSSSSWEGKILEPNIDWDNEL